MKTSSLSKAAVDESSNVSIASTPHHLSTLIITLEENDEFSTGSFLTPHFSIFSLKLP